MVTIMKKKTEKKATDSKTKKRLLKIFCILLIIGFLGAAAIAAVNGIVVGTASGKILTQQEAAALTDVDCILVLGCLVHADGGPSDMLHDRLQVGVDLYHLGAAPKLLMTGDHGRVDYDEVDAMKQFAVNSGIETEHIFMDHAGFSTYESMYRAKEIFGAKKIIIVTQYYHLYRAVYIANQLGLDAYGVSSDLNVYWGQFKRDVREVLARVKDFGTSIFKPEPTYLGETIPIWGDGNLTNDENSDFTQKDDVS